MQNLLQKAQNREAALIAQMLEELDAPVYVPENSANQGASDWDEEDRFFLAGSDQLQTTSSAN